MRLNTASTRLIHRQREEQVDERGRDARRPPAPRRRSWRSGVSRNDGITALTTSSTRTTPTARSMLAAGPGKPHERRVPPLVAQVAGHERDRLGPADDRRAENRQHEREDDRPDEVHVLDGVQRDAPEPARGGIAQALGHPAVGRFVDRDRQGERQQLDDDLRKPENQALHRAAMVAEPVVSALGSPPRRWCGPPPSTRIRRRRPLLSLAMKTLRAGRPRHGGADRRNRLDRQLEPRSDPPEPSPAARSPGGRRATPPRRPEEPIGCPSRRPPAAGYRTRRC